MASLSDLLSLNLWIKCLYRYLPSEGGVWLRKSGSVKRFYPFSPTFLIMEQNISYRGLPDDPRRHSVVLKKTKGKKNVSHGTCFSCRDSSPRRLLPFDSQSASSFFFLFVFCCFFFYRFRRPYFKTDHNSALFRVYS